MVKNLFILLFSISYIFGQQLLSTISSEKIGLTESIIFTIKINDIDSNPSVDIEKIEKNFSIISGPNIGSEYRFVNGSKSSSRSISWTLIPLKDGLLEIPSLVVNVGDKSFNTKIHQIKVSKQKSSDASKDLFLEIKVSDNKVVVGEQVKISYTFYTRVASKVISTEFPDFSDFWVEKLFDPVGKQFTPESWEDIEIDGFNYKLLKIYEVAIFPLKNGIYDLEPMIMKVETKEKDSSFSRLFWDDPFFDTFSQRTKAKILISDPIAIEVQSLSDIPKNFTGAVGEFTLNSSLSNSSIDEGSPVVFKMTLDGKGNLSNIGRPKINFPENIDIFEGETIIDKNISDNLSGSITWEYNLIPRKNGLFSIESIEIPYFNSYLNSWSKAFSNKIDFKVNKSPIFDSSDKDLLSSKSNVIRYNRIAKQKWISSSKIYFEKKVIYILLFSLVLFVIPLFESYLISIKNKILNFLSQKSALNNAINSLQRSKSIDNDAIRIITKFFYQKNIIDTKNLDITTLKTFLKNKIKEKDFEDFSKYLDDFQKKSFTPSNEIQDRKKIVNSFIKILKRIDLYV